MTSLHWDGPQMPNIFLFQWVVLIVTAKDSTGQGVEGVKISYYELEYPNE